MIEPFHHHAFYIHKNLNPARQLLRARRRGREIREHAVDLLGQAYIGLHPGSPALQAD
jgi:hypothetical protein